MAQAERLQKVIAQAGIASRRRAEQLIADGFVKVNGKKVTQMGVKVTPDDAIVVNGTPVMREQKVYYLFYKPRQVLSAVTDNTDRRVVTDYFSGVPERVYPVGRLDYDTSGLLILTNDGELANLLMHPRYEVDKTYVAKVMGIPQPADLAKFRKGVIIRHGRKTAPAYAKILSTDKRKNTAIVSLTIHQGMNHQVKLMFAALGFPVLKLKRETYGQLDLTGLRPGEYRELRPHEIAQLTNLAKNRPSQS